MFKDYLILVLNNQWVMYWRIYLSLFEFRWPEEGNFKSNCGAIVFNLTKAYFLPMQSSTFGYQMQWEWRTILWVQRIEATEPFNRENACWSETNSIGYRIPHNGKKLNEINMLKNMKCTTLNGLDYGSCLFTISELEVWGVSFNKWEKHLGC